MLAKVTRDKTACAVGDQLVKGVDHGHEVKHRSDEFILELGGVYSDLKHTEADVLEMLLRHHVYFFGE